MTPNNHLDRTLDLELSVATSEHRLVDLMGMGMGGEGRVVPTSGPKSEPHRDQVRSLTFWFPCTRCVKCDGRSLEKNLVGRTGRWDILRLGDFHMGGDFPSKGLLDSVEFLWYLWYLTFQSSKGTYP